MRRKIAWLQVSKKVRGMADSREAEARLFREAERLNRQARRRRRAEAPRRYGLAALWVFLAFAYCSQWDDMAHIPVGVPAVFAFAVALAVRGGGMGPGWLALALSLGCVWLRFCEPAMPARFCWLAVSLLAPLIVGAPHIPRRRVHKRTPRLSRSRSDPSHYPIWSDSPSR
jgi:hypothetical protein